MGLSDVARFRGRWARFLSATRWMEENWPSKPPEEKKGLWDQFVATVQEPVDLAWDKLSPQEQKILLPEMFPDYKEKIHGPRSNATSS
ncbi:MAG: hypothetical protein HY548_00010 [Elusimicrobia bacterium]|nr:hypothetical protein [Elusimicrobiota bacterium]